MAIDVRDSGRPVTATALIAVDLDHTLIYSRRWFSDAELDSARCVELRDDREISFMTTAAVASLEQLASDQIVIPATTRSVAQYERIALPGGPYRYVVASNGGTILKDGRPDLAWAATVAATLRAESIGLGAVLAALHDRIGGAWAHSVIVVDELFCYLLVDESALPSEFVASWRSWCEPRGWKVVRQDRKIYTLPRSLCKSHAVQEVRRRLTASGDLDAGALLLAAGDSELDAPLLAAADVSTCPPHGKRHSTGLGRNKTSVTTANGPKAAEEIVTWCRLQVEAVPTWAIRNDLIEAPQPHLRGSTT